MEFGKSYVAVAIVLGMLLSVVMVLPAMAEEDGPSTDFSVAALSAYIWRGQELSRDSIVIQPSMTVGYNGFSANIWSNLDTAPYVSSGSPDVPANWTETDFTFSYDKSFGPVSAGAGYIYYGLDGAADSQEVFLRLGVDTILAPVLTVYKDMANYPSWYFLLGVSHSMKLTDAVTLDLAASVSYLKSDDADDYPEINDQGASTGKKFDNLHDGVVSAGLPTTLAKYFTVTPSLAYTFPLSDDAKNEMKFRGKTGTDSGFVYGGVTVSMAY